MSYLEYRWKMSLYPPVRNSKTHLTLVLGFLWSCCRSQVRGCAWRAKKNIQAVYTMRKKLPKTSSVLKFWISLLNFSLKNISQIVKKLNFIYLSRVERCSETVQRAWLMLFSFTVVCWSRRTLWQNYDNITSCPYGGYSGNNYFDWFIHIFIQTIFNTARRILLS